MIRRTQISLDEMDGILFTGGAAGRQDNMSKQEMWYKAGKLRLGRRLLRLQRVGRTGTPHHRSHV
jgi:hypothetical protein